MHFPYIPNFDKRYGGLYGSQTDYASEYCREGFEQLRDQILQGTWKEGEKLPSEQELTETLGVSRSSVRQAIRTLADYGMVETRNGHRNLCQAADFRQLHAQYRAYRRFAV